MSGSEREPSGSEADRAGRRSKAQPGECCVSPNEVRVSSERSERNVGECSERSERNGAVVGLWGIFTGPPKFRSIRSFHSLPLIQLTHSISSFNIHFSFQIIFSIL